MNIFHNEKPVHDLRKKLTFEEKLQRFWSKNKSTIGLILVIICISILIILACYAVATGHMHMLSTEANVYEHMADVI